MTKFFVRLTVHFDVKCKSAFLNALLLTLDYALVRTEFINFVESNAVHVHAIKVYIAKRGKAPLILELGTRLGGQGSTYAPAALPAGNEPKYQAGWSPEQIWTFR